MYEIIKKIKENEKVFFDRLYDAVNSNNEFTYEPDGSLRISYFNNSKMPKLSDFKRDSIQLIEYEGLGDLRKKLGDMSLEGMSSEHMDELESQAGGYKMLYIPQSKKIELANLLLEVKGIKKQFIIRSVEVLKQMDPDYFEINPDIINKALKIYFEGEGKKGLLKILEKVIDNTNDNNYKQVVKEEKEREESNDDIGFGNMFDDGYGY